MLRADHFALLPLPRRRLALGLLGAAFVAVTSAVTALAFLSLVVYGIRLGALPALVAVPAAGLNLVLVVLLSRASYSVLGLIARRRAGSAFTGLLLAAPHLVARPGRTSMLAIVYGWALGTALLPLTLGRTEALPLAGAGMALMAATVACNLYADDGTALWLTLQTGTENPDVRGRQWAHLLVFGVPTVAATVGLTLRSGHACAWPWVLTLVPALLGGGVGLAVVTSVVALAPGPDAHKRPDNPLEHGETSWQSQVLFWICLLLPVPAVVPVIVGTVLGNPVLVWSGVPIGLLTGVLLAWWLGRVAINRLRARGPEMLFLMRTGRPGTTAAGDGTGNPEAGDPEAGVPASKLTGRESLAAGACWILGPLCLFPQGLVPMVFLLAGSDLTLWFLPLHLPDPWRWPGAVVLSLLGIFLVYEATRLTVKSTRPAPHPGDRSAADTDAGHTA
ncbi:hypothetical protein [Jidongwangia harbinensis]|uniref:hypothetical protein n=1 Tax=Jidongwangia harbinensis TaxID=2878561 RepID=UPI001CD9BD56|nr:hypothetical protein [Jidongwangia harbinensis]MCA2214921.1 hypothetical protein [Jidongwangia harbinensis]